MNVSKFHSVQMRDVEDGVCMSPGRFQEIRKPGLQEPMVYSATSNSGFCGCME